MRRQTIKQQQRENLKWYSNSELREAAKQCGETMRLSKRLGSRYALDCGRCWLRMFQAEFRRRMSKPC